LLFTLIAFAMGCTDNPTGPTSNALETARRVWATNGYSSYQFTIRMDCFCAVNGPVRVTVANDSTVSATVIATGQAIDPRWVPNIKSLFSFIEHGIAINAAVLQVNYDPNLGYPSKIVYDGATNIADDEVTYTVSDVASLFTTRTQGIAPAAPARRGSAPAVTRPLSMRTAAP
jgi:hypothetical protein